MSQSTPGSLITTGVLMNSAHPNFLIFRTTEDTDYSQHTTPYSTRAQSTLNLPNRIVKQLTFVSHTPTHYDPTTLTNLFQLQVLLISSDINL